MANKDSADPIKKIIGEGKKPKKGATAVAEKPKVASGEWGIKTKNSKTGKAGNTPRKGPVPSYGYNPKKENEKAEVWARKKADYVTNVSDENRGKKMATLGR